MKSLIVLLSLISFSAFADSEGKAYCIKGALESHVVQDIMMASSQCSGNISVPQGKCVATVLTNRLENNIMFALSDCQDVTSLPMAICLEGAIRSGVQTNFMFAKSDCENAIR